MYRCILRHMLPDILNYSWTSKPSFSVCNTIIVPNGFTCTSSYFFTNHDCSNTYDFNIETDWKADGDPRNAWIEITFNRQYTLTKIKTRYSSGSGGNEDESNFQDVKFSFSDGTDSRRNWFLGKYSRFHSLNHPPNHPQLRSDSLYVTLPKAEVGHVLEKVRMQFRAEND